MLEATTASAIIAVGPGTKSEADSFAKALTEEVESGVTNPLSMFAKLNAFSKAIEVVKENIRSWAVSEAAKYGGGKFNAFGCDMEVKEAGTKYDYSACKDVEWESLDAQIKGLTEQRKQREIFLKTIPGCITTVDEATGEVTKIHAPKKESTTTVFVKLT